MIDIANLVKDSSLRGNYFAPDAYVQGDIEFGLIANRSGARLLALPETLLSALYASLDEEIGQGAGAVLFSCGRWWGRSFYRRFAQELAQYYNKPLLQMEMIEFIQCLKQCWKTHGWGILDVDLKYYQQGFLVVKTWNSLFAQVVPSTPKFLCSLEAGILSAFFSQLTGRDLDCTQISCEAMGAESNYFVLGIPERIKPAQAWLEEGHDSATIMELLCRNQAPVTSQA